MQPESGIKSWQWVVTIIVIIILIIIGVLVFGNKTPGTPGGDDMNSTTTDVVGTALNRIVMSDQYPGNVVYLSSVQLENPGWVSIQSDKNGKPGDVIGSAYFAKGINPGKITLSKSMTEGGTYYAILRKDDGDGKFDAAKDVPLQDNAGNVIMKVFKASASVGAEIKG